MPAEKPFPLTSLEPAGAWGWARTAVIYLGDSLGLGLLVLGLSLWLVQRPLTGGAPVVVGRWYWLRFALPCAAVWSLYLLAFWPGIMSQDSVDQWHQLLQGRYEDAHPAFHTLTVWLITRVWLSPAAVALVQIVILSAAIGFGLAMLRSYGVPAWALWAACGLSALSLNNGLMIVTLWKDVFFSIAVLVFTFLLLAMVRSSSHLLRANLYLAALGLAALLVALYRQNGPLIAFGTLALLLLAYPRFWLRLVAVLAGVVVLWLAIRGPVYDSLSVRKTPAFLSLQPIVDQIGFYVQAGALESDHPLLPDEVRFLDALHPLADGWKSLDCYRPSAFLLSDQTHREVLNNNVGRVFDIYLRLVRNDPGFIIPELIRCDSLVWRISQPLGTDMTSASIALDDSGKLLTIMLSPGSVVIESYSKLPTLEWWLAQIYFGSTEARLIGLVWRPALYSYVLLASVILVMLRLKSWRYLLLCVPAMLTTMPFIVMPVSPEFRYHYPAYLVSLLLFIPLQFIPPPAPARSAEAYPR